MIFWKAVLTGLAIVYCCGAFGFWNIFWFQNVATWTISERFMLLDVMCVTTGTSWIIYYWR